MFAASKSGSAAEPTDAQFNYVTMLLHGNGTNGAQNNTFVDSSTNNFTITRNGNTTQGTFTPYGSNWSNYLNGSSSLSVNVSGVAAGTSTFTFETWVYLNAYPSADAPFYDTRSSNGATTTAMQFGVYSTGALKFYDGTETNLGGTVPLNQWVHIALVRNGSNVMTPYINGTATGTTVSSTRNFTDQYFWIGSVPGPTSPYINAYLSNLRWVVGTAVYTSNFTPSTTPLTAITNTKILTCQANRFVDASANSFTITLNGSPSVQRFSPFSPTTAYSTSVIGGSGYFDGSGDYLTVPTNAAFNIGTSSFTLECWFYSLGSTSYQAIVSAWGTTQSDSAFEIATNGTNLFIQIAYGSSQVSFQPSAPPSYQWNHVVMVGNGSTLSAFINGTRVGTQAFSSSINNASYSPAIGYRVAASNYPFLGYVSNPRLVKGTAVYDPTSSTLTVPTAPLTAITNTSLLLSYTNAGILDNAMMNDLETVGNAQISTSVKKYGTGSMYFDGTDDRLNMPSSPNLAFGTGDFTLEMWAYFTSTANFPTLTDSRSSTGSTSGFNLGLSSAKVQLYTTSQLLIGSSTLSANTWYHIAITRASGTLKIWLNGTQDATVSNSTNWSDQTFVVGATPSAANFMTGYIDDLRITKGYARYTANFTAPTTAFADKG